MTEYLDHTRVAQQLLDQQGDINRLTEERDGAYRERAQLLAWLATLHGPHAVLVPAIDIDDEDGWHLLFLTVAGRQMSWHISPRDTELFKHVELVDVGDARAQWDGHTTGEKYQRIRTMPWGDMRDAVRTPGPAEEALRQQLDDAHRRFDSLDAAVYARGPLVDRPFRSHRQTPTSPAALDEPKEQ